MIPGLTRVCRFDGKTNDEAAKTLAISIKTVEKHRQRVMDKLDLHNIAAITRYAIARGLVQEFP